MTKRLIILLLVFSGLIRAKGDQIDIGIFESTTVSNNIEIKIRPDFNISSIQTVTAILYTVRWNNPFVSISVQYIFPFFIAPQGTPVLHNGYYYQVFAAAPLNPLAMTANQEYVISSFTHTNGSCAHFEIIEDDWTAVNNGNFYIEFLGTEKTGVIYQPGLFLGSVGGHISGNDTIYKGEPTGDMILSGFSGNVNTWQRKISDGPWQDIAGTAGLTVYSEIPETAGTFSYRAAIAKGLCPEAYSEPLVIEVLPHPSISLNLKVFLEGSFGAAEMNTYLNQQNMIPTSQPYNVHPWYYPGTETMGDPVNDAVDWVLVELRETGGDAFSATPDKIVGRQAALLLKNGDVTEATGTGNLYFDLVVSDNLYVVVMHRNHLAVMSATGLQEMNGTYSWDFSSGMGQAHGSQQGHNQVAPGIWAMIAGDSNSDGTVGMNDISGLWEEQAGRKGYLPSDMNLDAQVNNTDKNDLWYKNTGQQSQVPF
jgi:hypothetical protein